MRPYDWVLFDADNTVFDFNAAERFSLRRAMMDFGLTFQHDHHLLYQRINKECWTAFEEGRLSKDRLRLERFERFFHTLEVVVRAEEFGTTYLTYLGKTGHLLPEAQDLVETLGKHYRLGLITNGLKEVQRPRLANTPLADAFEVVVVSDEIGVAKPDGAFFEYAFGEMGKPDPRNVLVVGDNLNADIRGALEYGTDACWFNPDGRDRYLPVEPTLEIRGLPELKQFLLEGGR